MFGKVRLNVLPSDFSVYFLFHLGDFFVYFLFHSGDIGDWKHHFTVRQNERFNELYENQMKGSKLNIQYE